MITKWLPNIAMAFFFLQSPSGSVHTDVNYQDGYFLLPLQAVETGNYTCSLTGNSPARRCLASNSTLLRETTVYVDDENVKWTVMEANQREFIEKEERLRQENEALKSQVQNLTQRLHQLQGAIDIENTRRLSPLTVSMNHSACMKVLH